MQLRLQNHMLAASKPGSVNPIMGEKGYKQVKESTLDPKTNGLQCSGVQEDIIRFALIFIKRKELAILVFVTSEVSVV